MESTVLGSRYELLERVGMGGMALVYKAKDKMLNRFVAVKILREEFKENEDFIRRFKIESQAAASLSHQNIAQIYDVGEENGINYIVMEFLEGETLKKHILNNNGALSRKEAMNYSMQICRALEHAHSKYVVHRDIKPQNIVITESGKLKLADFGIARAANNTTTVNAKNNVAVGSAHYLSPEQARGGYTDHRSDIYSLGVVMYEMFCGKLPFDAEDSVSVVMQHLHEEPVPPCEVNPDLPEGIEAIILKAMRKEQRLRYKSAAQILEDLVLVFQNPSIDVSELHASADEDIPEPKKDRQRKNSHRSAQRHQNHKKQAKTFSFVPIIITIVLFFAIILAGAFFVNKLLHPDTGEEVEIPNVVGLSFEMAVQKAEQASTDDITFTVLKKKEIFDDQPKGTILEQDPEGGGKVKRSRQINVTVSKGPVRLTLIDYTDRSASTVKKDLEELGIIVKIVEEPSENFAPGTIIDQNPKADTQLAEGETVTLTVAKRPDDDPEAERTIVPPVINMTEEDAISEISEYGLKYEIIKDDTSSLPEGTVIKQSPDAESDAFMGDTVKIYVSTGKNKSEDPDEPDDPDEPQNPQTKETVSITLTNLGTNTKRVRIVGNGVTVFEADITSSTGTETVTFEAVSSPSYDIYYDGKWIREVKN